MCGEKPDSRNTLQLSPGSPPHVRGKAANTGYQTNEVWDHPAYAGKVLLQSSGDIREWDHPAYAGKRSQPEAERTLKGSPRVCGKSQCNSSCTAGKWITPRMREKPDRILWSTGRKDHPRMCGEKQRSAESVTIPMGSTPACAGKRQALAKALSRSRDHPRMCGEKTKKIP